MQVLLKQAIIRTEKAKVAALLEDEIAVLVSEGYTNDTELADEALRRAVEKYRNGQRLRTIAGRKAKGRELRHRLLPAQRRRAPLPRSLSLQPASVRETD
jgi:hypothetical protein